MAIDQPPAIDTVVVQSARLPPAPGDRAFSIVQLGPQVLSTRPRLDEALTDVPGVSLFRRTSSLGANPTTQGISLRGVAGSGASRALVTLDGVPQNDPFGGWVIWSGVPSELIEGASLVRGAGAGPYGAGALTGAVSLDERTRIPGGVLGELSAGSLDYRRGAVVVDAGATEATRILLSASAEHSDGWTPVQKERRGRADVPLTLDDWSASMRVLSDLGGQVLAVRASTFREKRSAGLVGASSRVEGWTGSATLAAPADAGIGWRLQGWVRGSNLANSSVAVAANRANTTPANNQYSTPALGYGFNAALRRTDPAFTWELGADLRITEGESRELFRFMAPDYTRLRVAGGRTVVGGVYAEASRTAGDWLVTGGLRLDHWRSLDAQRLETDRANGAVTLNEQPADRDGLPTARAGLRRDFQDGLFLRSAAYAGFRPATLNELHRPFRVGNDITEANAALKPERLYGMEVGAGQAYGAGSWNVGVFYNRLNDAIANVTLGIGPGTFPIAGFIPPGGVLRQRQNAGSVDAYGFEAEAEHRLGTGFTLNLAAAYTHAEVDGGSSAPQLTGLRPAQTPRFTALAGASWRPIEPLSLRLDLRYEGARFDDDLNSRVLENGVSLDARMDWRVAGPVSLFVAAENLLDEKIETAQTADGVESYSAPRVVRAGLSIRR